MFVSRITELSVSSPDQIEAPPLLEDRAPTHFTRALKIPQVLDYIFAPAWWGHSRVAWQDQRHTGNESSDHAAIFLDLPCTIRPGRPARPKRPVHKDWDFESDTAKRYFAALAFESLVTSHPDEEFAPSDRIAEVLSSSAKNIPTKSVHRSLPQKKIFRATPSRTPVQRVFMLTRGQQVQHP